MSDSCYTASEATKSNLGFYGRKLRARRGYRLTFVVLLLVVWSIKLGLQLISRSAVYSYFHISDDGDNLQPYHSRHLLGINIVGSSPDINCTPQAIDNFPRDLFTNSERRHGLLIIHFLATAYMFVGLAIVCDEYFVPCLECISEALNLQPDVAGATFMAAGSSAPELATTVIGVFIAKDDIGLGAVVGSADYNIMFVISVCALFAKTVIFLNWWPLVRDSVVYCFCIILLAVVISDEVVHWYEALLFLFCYAGYIVLMHFNPRLDAFFKQWCATHPSFCPRAMHSVSEMESAGVVVPGHGGSGSGGRPGSDQIGGDIVPRSMAYAKLEEQGSIGGGDFDMKDSSDENEEEEEGLIEPFRQKEADWRVNVKPENGPPSTLTPHAARDGPPVGGICGGCFARLTWPDPATSSLGTRFLHAISLPLRAGLCLTVPDCAQPTWRRFFWITFVMSCVWIGMYTYIMIWMITVIGYTLRIPDSIMGLTFIAAGSSVPDAIASVIVVREGEGDMAVSNAIGSNVFDILICMGLPWFIKTLTSQHTVNIYSRGLVYATLTLLSTVVILLVCTHLNRWRLTKRYGIVLMVVYLAYLILCILYELNMFGYVHPPECESTAP